MREYDYGMDGNVALDIMGWRILSHWEPGIVKHLLDENQCEVTPPSFSPYSTDARFSEKVLIRMRDLGYFCDVLTRTMPHGDCFVVNFFKKGETPDLYKATISKNLSEAICESALKNYDPR